MAVLFDFSANKQGGGVQLSFNFLSEITKFPQLRQGAALLLPGSGPLLEFKSNAWFREAKVCPSSPFGRIRFEHGELQRWIRRAGVRQLFTFMGPGLPHSGDVTSVVNVTYPIICYPDSPYWRYIPAKEGIKKRILNYARVQRLKKADLILVETEVMARRIVAAIDRRPEEIRVVSPAPSLHVREKRGAPSGRFNLLCLSGLAPHKNLWRLHSVAHELERQGGMDVHFTITADREAWLRTLREAKVSNELVARRFNFVGPVHPSKIGELYDRSDAMLIISDLESFSSNYMEAWKAGVPIIASDRDFSRQICGDSAVYVEPHDGGSVAAGILKVRSDLALRERLVAEGKKRFELLPTVEQRIELVLKLLQETYPNPT